MGKGSAPRPFSVSHDEYGSNFDAIFGKKKTAEPEAYSCPDCGEQMTPRQLEAVSDNSLMLVYSRWEQVCPACDHRGPTLEVII